MSSPRISAVISILCLNAAASGALGGPAMAQEIALEGIVIESAGLTPVETDKIGSAYTLITGAEMEARQIRHAGDALRSVAGVSVNRSGGAGGLTQLRIRGAEGNHLLVLIDGVEVNSLGAGDFDFATLLAADIDRIEVLRGPQSGVFGANALSGVINIVTRRGSGAPQATVSVEGGSFETRAVSANASAGSDTGYFSVSAGRYDSDGYNYALKGDEADGYEKQTIFGRAGVALTDDVRVDGMARYQFNDAEVDQDADGDGLLDDIAGDQSRNWQKMARIALEADTFNKAWTHKAFASYFEDRLDSGSIFSNFTSSNLGERWHYGYQSTLRFETPSLMTKHVLVGLIEHKDEDFFAEADFPSFGFGYANAASRSQTGFVVEYRAEIADALFLSGNLRHDDNETFDDALTYRGTVAYLFRATGTRLHASIGKGVTNPTFFEQFGFDLNFQGNPNLKPEESVGWDIGVEQTLIKNVLVVDVTYFNATLTDEIVGSGTTVVNQDGESERQGVEVQLTYKPIEGLAITGSYTYTDATEPDGREEIRRPQHAGALNVNYLFAAGRAQINFGLIYNGDMQDTLFDFAFFPDYPRVNLDEYIVVNVSGSYKLDDSVTLFGRAENLLDEDYEEVIGYASQPVAVFGGVKVTLGGGAAPLERKAD